MTQPTAPFAQFAPRTPLTNPLRAPITAAYRRPEPEALAPLLAQARLSADQAAAAEQLALRIASELGVVGSMAVELFETTDGTLVVNELAMRPHNSGHWTLEGAQTSQFANHLRAVMGLPLGATTLLAPTVMLNLIGELPEIRQLLALPDLHLHLYGKQEKPGRKLGHLTLRCGSPEALQRQWAQLQRLTIRPAVN